MFKINNRKTRPRCKICSKLTLETLEQGVKLAILQLKLAVKTPVRWRRSRLFIVNFVHISHLVLVALLLTLNRYMLAGIRLITPFFCNNSIV